MGLYNTFKSDGVKEREGRWFSISAAANEDGSVPKFKLARMHSNNPAYQAALERVYKEFGVAIDNEILESGKAKPILLEVFVTTVLLDWENVQDHEERPIPFSVENATTLLNDLPDLYDVLKDQARKLGNFRKSEEDEAVKKSSPPSDQSSANQPE